MVRTLTHRPGPRAALGGPAASEQSLRLRDFRGPAWQAL
jgi:hypothetical protein